MSKLQSIRSKQCELLASCSNCPRGKFGALVYNSDTNVLLVDGYNGGPRGGGKLCGGDICTRDRLSIPSGQRTEVGCHHAEMNAICNAARHGISLQGATMIVTGEPCLMCAKMIHHAGIQKVIYKKGGYTTSEGVSYLDDNKIITESV
jgi:dCMP deaminase